MSQKAKLLDGWEHFKGWKAWDWFMDPYPYCMRVVLAMSGAKYCSNGSSIERPTSLDYPDFTSSNVTSFCSHKNFCPIERLTVKIT